jgi:CMP-N,N'-diacetyllegionaminic acid synthase
MIIKSLILARGGSKGIHNKNIIDLNGKPLVSYAISAAIQSKANDVWVSTDCANIANVSQKYGAKTIIRPSNISGDKSKSEDALLHFAHNCDFDLLVFIQPTSPLLLSSDIDNGIYMIINHNYDSIFSVYKEHWIPRWNLNISPDNWSVNSRPMRQDMPEKYVENGAFYITTKTALLSSKLRYSGKLGVIEMPFYRSFQIDTHEDLYLIKKLL